MTRAPTSPHTHSWWGGRHLSAMRRPHRFGRVQMVGRRSRGFGGAGALAALAFALGAAAPAPTRAQPAGDDSIVDALPGFLRVPSALPGATPWSVAAGTGYGWTEDVLGLDDRHHQLAGHVAVAWQPLPWLGAALRLDGRYDRHTFGDGPNDDGWVGDPRLVLAAQGQPARGVGLGGRATVWVPGGDAPSLDFGATTLDLEGVATWRGGPLRLGGRVGWRLDRSASSARAADTYRPGDLLALQVSPYDALLLGAAGSWDAGPATVSVEWTWDLLVGDGAPPPRESPMRVAVGAAVRATPVVAVEGWVEVSPSARPDPFPLQEPRVTEPRLRVRVGLVVRPGAGAAAAPPPEGPAPEPPPAPADDAAGEDAAAPEAPPTGALRGLVRGFDGRPVVGATITVLPTDAEAGETPDAGTGAPPDGAAGEPPPLEAETDADGTFDLTLAPGEHRVRITAPRFRPQSRRVTVEAGGVTILNADLRRRRGGR